MAVTSIEKLKKIAQGQEVELQGWDEVYPEVSYGY